MNDQQAEWIPEKPYDIRLRIKVQAVAQLKLLLPVAAHPSRADAALRKLLRATIAEVNAQMDAILTSHAVLP